MKSWYELKQKPETAEETIIVLAVEAIHESKSMDTESEEKVYNVLCARVGASIDGQDEVEDESDPDLETDDEENNATTLGHKL